MSYNDMNSMKATGAGAAVDVGLRAYMQKVYNIMAMGLVVTGVVAYSVSQMPGVMAQIHGTFLGIVVALSPLAIIFFGLNPNRVMRMSAASVQGLYYLMTGLIGLSMSYIFMAYTGESITRVFFITAGMFAATSIYGYTTKRDLSSMGGFLMMGLIGLIIASIVNIFMQSAALHYAISYIGVFVFVGLTAWDTQRIKEMYRASLGNSEMVKMATMGALSLYLDFINLFQFLLAILGNRE